MALPRNSFKRNFWIKERGLKSQLTSLTSELTSKGGLKNIDPIDQIDYQVLSNMQKMVGLSSKYISIQPTGFLYSSGVFGSYRTDMKRDNFHRGTDIWYSGLVGLPILLSSAVGVASNYSTVPDIENTASKSISTTLTFESERWAGLNEVNLRISHLSAVNVASKLHSDSRYLLGMTGTSGEAFSPHAHIEFSRDSNGRKKYLNYLTALPRLPWGAYSDILDSGSVRKSGTVPSPYVNVMVLELLASYLLGLDVSTIRSPSKWNKFLKGWTGSKATWPWNWDRFVNFLDLGVPIFLGNPSKFKGSWPGKFSYDNQHGCPAQLEWLLITMINWFTLTYWLPMNRLNCNLARLRFRGKSDGGLNGSSIIKVVDSDHYKSYSMGMTRALSKEEGFPVFNFDDGNSTFTRSSVPHLKPATYYGSPSVIEHDNRFWHSENLDLYSDLPKPIGL